MLDGALQYRASIAEQTGVFQAADAPPDDGLLATVVPVDAPVEFATLSAADDLGEAVVAGEAALLSGCLNEKLNLD